jgi:hypothetical protein
VIHIIAWSIILSVPFFFTGRETQELTFLSYVRKEVVPISLMIVFYVNYLFLIDEYLFTKHTGRFILYNAVIIIVLLISVHYIFRLLPPPEMGHRPPPRMGYRDFKEEIAFFSYNLAIYMLVTGLSVAIKMTAQWYKTQQENTEISQERIKAEIQNLKSQLNPHFLFNTLNNIYSLIAISQERAQGAVLDLSKLLRYVLYESSQPLVPLEKEVEFIKNYVELMKIRLSKNVELKTDINIKDKNLMIAPLLFISPIENAFKHGVSNNTSSFINIVISQSDNKLVCLIQNSYFPKRDESDKSGSGIGLQNLQRRLALLYNGHYTFESKLKGDSYESFLMLELKPNED